MQEAPKQVNQVLSLTRDAMNVRGTGVCSNLSIQKEGIGWNNQDSIKYNMDWDKQKRRTRIL